MRQVWRAPPRSAGLYLQTELLGERTHEHRLRQQLWLLFARDRLAQICEALARCAPGAVVVVASEIQVRLFGQVRHLELAEKLPGERLISILHGLRQALESLQEFPARLAVLGEHHLELEFRVDGHAGECRGPITHLVDQRDGRRVERLAAARFVYGDLVGLALRIDHHAHVRPTLGVGTAKCFGPVLLICG